MRKTISILLAMILTIAVCIAPVSAMAAQPVTITSVTTNADATVTVTWDNPNGGKVTAASMIMDDGTAGNRMSAEFDISGSSYTYRDLAPGKDYILVVMPDVDVDNAGMDLVSVPEITEKFDEIYFTLQDANLAYFDIKGDSYSYNYAKNLTNQEIHDMLEKKQFWVKMDFDHVAFSYAQTFQSLTVVTSPTGYVTTAAREIEIPKNTTGFWQTMVYMNQALDDMYNANGEIPTGKYTVEFYLDGCFAGESYFVIK